MSTSLISVMKLSHNSLTQGGCRHILDEIKDAETELLKSTGVPRGRLKVSLPAIGYRLLMEKLPEFMSSFPDIELELDFTDRIVDIIEERFDAVVRSGTLPDSRLMARKLGPMRFVVCGSPQYLAARGIPRHPGELQTHACLRFRYPSSGKLQEWKLDGETDAVELRLPCSLVCNNAEALMASAMHGLGLAYLPLFLAKEAIAKGALLPVLEEYEAARVTFWVLWPSKRHMPPRLRVFLDFLCTKLLA
ncbi:DNA-binding transcriptional LysR family regulator [Oxalobacteraceae bacterium GrIS 1.11]